MASWAALNADSAPRAALEEARDGATQEAQDAHNAVLYGRALRLQQKEKVEEASAIYTELLETSPGLSSRLRYLCAKNLATLETERGAFEPALQRYAEALALDATDVLVWYQMGKTALDTGQLWLARQAFESGFQLDATFWPLAHALCDVLHAVGDGAAYQRVAQYLLEKDPSAGRVGGPLHLIDSAVDPEFRACTSQSTPSKQTKSTLKRRTPALEALGAASKKRKAMADASLYQEQVAANRAPLKYLLQQSSWLTLGKLLLEAYDDVTSERDPSSIVSTRHVHVSDDFVDEPSVAEHSNPQPTSTVTTEAPDAIDKPADEKSAVVVDLVADNNEEKGDDGTAGEPVEVDEADDGDQDDGGASVVQSNRRKSRRHQEKLREEHALAAKLAREKNLAYRLQAYVPETVGKGNDLAYRELVLRLDGDAVILEHTNGDFVHKFENVLPSAPVDETAAAEDSSKEGEGGGASGASDAVGREQISKFVASTMATKDGVDIVRLLQAYLNQCGAWADRALVTVSEDQDQTLHLVCLWAEKVVRGRLGEATPTTPNDKGSRSRICLGRHPQDGLTIEAHMFLLELRLDDVIHHKVLQGQARSRKAMRSYFAQLDDIVRDAQALLLDICWSTDSDDIDYSEDDAKKTSRLLGRLFWLCGTASEQRGNTATTKEYFAKCKQSLEELDEGAVVFLPNLREPATLSIVSLEQKMADLQFSNVCNEVQAMETTSRFDEAQGRLLSHFFPTNGQAPRINELLEDFSKQREQEHGDSAGDVDTSENNFLELLLESVENSTASKCSDKILILLVILSKLLEVVSENLQKVSSQPKKADGERHTLSVAVQAIELTVDKLASVIVGESDASTTQICSHTKQAVMAVVTVLLKPEILLLFDSPRDVFQVVHEMADQLSTMVAGAEASTDEMAPSAADVWGPLVVVAATSLRTVRSLSFSDRQRMLTVLTATSANAKSKKKQSGRHDRVRSYAQTVVGFLAGHVQLLVSLLPADQVKGLMEDCCPMLKEEEEMTRRHHDSDKTAKRTLAVGALLFLQLIVAVLSTDTDKESSLKQLVGLVRLLHERLGEYELCSLDCFDKAIGSGNCVGKTFVQVAASILQDRYADHNSIQHAKKRPQCLTPERKQPSENVDAHSDFEESGDEGNGVGDGDDEEGYEHTLAQCYRCLYDAHILASCVDHKTGTSLADLDSTSATTAHHLAQLAIPIMLRRPPRSNAQKKDNLKILFAIQRAINSMEDEGQPPATAPPQLLVEYLSPRSLLTWKEEIPVAVLEVQPSTRVDSCLEDLWFLLGENFILHRVRKRSNLSELVEMERKIKERVAYLLKDVEHYRPRRIKSWVRLGRSTKELYEVASDACAVVLGRKWRKRHLLATCAVREGGADGDGIQEPPSFHDVVLNSSLFEKMKAWHDLDDAAQKSSYRVSFQKVPPITESVEADATAPPPEFSMEETAELYLAQVVEFSRRCFVMAAALATRPVEKRDDGDMVIEKDDETTLSAESDEDTVELMQTAVDVYEDCGLLMYNQLRGFAVLRHDDDIKSSRAFPTSLYGQIVRETLRCFQDGLELSAKSDPDAHDVRFRLHYMIGKVLKKRLWFQRRPPHGKNNSDDASLAMPATSPKDVMKCFANAEEEHEKGKMDKSIVHAFYQLQATRLMLILDEPITSESLRLVCEHFFEEASDDDSEDEDEGIEGEERTEKEGSVKREKVGTEDVAALLKASEQRSSRRRGNAADNKDLLHLAQGWLFFNVVDALESISDEDRYFHASRYTLAKAMYRYSEIVERLSVIRNYMPLPSPSTSAKNCIAALADKKAKKKNDGNSCADIALKEMHPLFDKRRPQVVAIWLSEHVPASKKFEELNQRQLKFDFCRLKYFSYFVSLLEESEAYGRLKEIGSWVLACKEEHDAIDEMLGIVFHARSIVQLSRLRDYVCTELADQLEQHQKSVNYARSQLKESAAGDQVHQDETKESQDPESASESLLKELSKAYINYLDVAHASARLTAVMGAPVLQEIFSLAEFPIAYLHLVGATEFPKTFDVLDRDEILTASHIATMMLKLRAVLLNDPSPGAVTACASADWQPLLHAARTFCEDRWPERQSGKQATTGKHARKARPAKASVSTTSAISLAPALPSSTEAVETPSAAAGPDVLTAEGPTETPVGGDEQATVSAPSAAMQPAEI